MIMCDTRARDGLKEAFTFTQMEMEIEFLKVLNPRLVNLVCGHPTCGPILAFGTEGPDRRLIREFKYFEDGHAQGHNWPEKPLIVETRQKTNGYQPSLEYRAYDGVTGELMGTV